VVDSFVVCSLQTAQGYDAFLDSVQAMDDIYLVEPYYTNRGGLAFPVSTRFCVAFQSETTQSEIDSINQMYGVAMDHEIDGMHNVFVLRNTAQSGLRLLEAAIAYYELNETRYAHPDFGVWVSKFSYELHDRYHQYQSHSKKVIGQFNSASVWDFAGVMAETVVVAVIDDGVTSHEDLPSNRILAGIDYADLDNDPITFLE
jgi:hypothetical protein